MERDARRARGPGPGRTPEYCHGGPGCPTARLRGGRGGRAQKVKEELAKLQAEWTRLRGLEGDLNDAIRRVKASAPSPEQMHQAPHVIYRFLTQCDIKLKEAGKMSG